MLDMERKVADHYTHGTLAEVIAAGLAQMRLGSDADPLDLLAAVDEFHMGGRAATKGLAEWLDLGAANRVVDIGCGLGGTARFLHSAYGCAVEGIDLTPEYIEVGRGLNRAVGLSDGIRLAVASAVDLPFEAAAFDRATMLHVGMNIADKAALMGEVARVTRRGALFGIYDVMRQGAGPVVYPVAWAADEATSFLGAPEDYRAALEGAGFEVLRVQDNRTAALAFFDAIKARLAAGGPPPLGLHIVMGRDAKAKVANMHANLLSGAISPVQMLARRV